MFVNPVYAQDAVSVNQSGENVIFTITNEAVWTAAIVLGVIALGLILLAALRQSKSGKIRTNT